LTQFVHQLVAAVAHCPPFTQPILVLIPSSISSNAPELTLKLLMTLSLAM
jgi:hypothetical protein